MTFHRFGLGTYGMTGDAGAASIAGALDVGYRHLDTAQSYDNEAAVGEAIERADVDREDLFVATKISSHDLGYDDAIETARESRERLGVDTIDLLYVHWPQNAYDREETLPALDELRAEGVFRHVGLSNFTPELLDEARETLDAPVFAHQVEMHPLLQQAELRAYAREHDHWLVAYCPIARGEVFDVPEIVEVAEKHGATPAQVSLAWSLSKERVAPIPKAADPEHVRENWAARELDLDGEDVEKIDGIDRQKRCVDPDDAPWH